MASAAKLDHRSPLPLWAQVLDDLRARLTSGEFSHEFPTDRQLIDEYGVSRHTVRDAVRRLQDEGVLERARGKGSFVRRLDLEQPVGPLYSLFRSIENQGYEQRSKVLEADERVDAGAAAQLRVAANARLVYLRRLRLADDVPIAVDELWLPARFGRPLLKVDLEHTAVYVELERVTGVRPTAGWERIHPGLASKEHRELLGIPARQAVFEIERRTESDGLALEFRRTIVRGDRYSFVTRWTGAASTDSQFDPRRDVPG